MTPALQRTARDGRSTAAGTVARALLVTCAFLFGAGCGGGTSSASEAGAAPAFDVRGAGIVVRSEAAFTRRGDFPARVETTLAAALQYWGGGWADLAGKNVVFEGGRNVSCAGNPGAVGCYDGDIRVSTQDAGTDLRCVEETVLVHEVGHAIIGDPGHDDPRWMDFESVTRDLQGRPGYDGSGEDACPIIVNMWRHPPGA